MTAPYKSEYFDGEIFPMGEIEGNTPEAMAGALPAHNLISTNIIFNLAGKLRNKGYDVFGSDQRIFMPQTGLYTYPDVSIFCKGLQYQDEMTLTNPVLLVEILSKITEGYNRGSKFEMYCSIPSLVEYLMVDSQIVHVELWRKDNNKWTLVLETNDLIDTVELKSMENSFLINDFYFRALEMMTGQKRLH